MEETKKAIEGEQPDSKQNELKKETTDVLMNENPVVRKELLKASEILGARASSRKSSTTSSGGKSTSSGSSKQEKNQTATPRKRNKVVSKAVPTSSTSKMVVSGESDESIPLDRELKNKTDATDQKGSSTNEKKVNKKAAGGKKTDGDSDQLKEQRGSGKDLKALKKKAEKSEKKVGKLKKKFKKAKKNEVKKSKLKLLKDKIIKAIVKFKRRMKKLKNANA